LLVDGMPFSLKNKKKSLSRVRVYVRVAQGLRGMLWMTPYLGVADEMIFLFSLFFLTGVARNAGGWQASGFGGVFKYPPH
jgi:hypothetical protein